MIMEAHQCTDPHDSFYNLFWEREYNWYMAKLKLLKKLLLEMAKVDRHQNGGMPSPMFFNDKDITGHYPNKSELRNARKKK